MPTDPAKNVAGNSENFTNFMRRLVAVPHSEIKAKLEAEKTVKRTSTKRRVSRVSDASPKQAN
jgi:hypothetical protein